MKAKMIGNLDKTNGHRPECECNACLIPYAFVRAGGFYVIELNGDAVAVENAESNPGTLRVEKVNTGEVVWSQA